MKIERPNNSVEDIISFPDQGDLIVPIRKVKSITSTRGSKLRVAMSATACKEFKVTAHEIELHNSHCDGYEEGWASAMKYVLTELKLLS